MYVHLAWWALYIATLFFDIDLWHFQFQGLNANLRLGPLWEIIDHISFKLDIHIHVYMMSIIHSFLPWPERFQLQAGLETYFFSHSQSFASDFNFNSQIAVSNSQLVFPHFWTVFNIAVWYGYSFLGLELGSSFSPPLAEDLLAPAFFFPSFKEIHYLFCHCCHMARHRICVTRRFDFSTAFTLDLLKHLRDQDWDLV